MSRGSLGFGIVRSVEASQGRAKLAELCAMLTSELGTVVVPHQPGSYAELYERCEKGDIALAWVPPIATARLQASGAVSVLALPVRRGAVTYRAALITQDSGPKGLSELQGATVAWVDRESCSGYIMPRLLLAAASLDPKGLFSRELFLGSHSAVVEAVVTKRVTVGATFCAVDGAIGERAASATPGGSTPPPAAVRAPSARPPPPTMSLPAPTWSGPDGRANSALRVLAATAPIPNDAITVSAQLPVDLRSKLLRWFLDLKHERAKRHCADLFGASGFRIAAPEHFAALQQMMWAARTPA